MSISIHELLAVARESEGVKAVQGDAMLCEKRFAPDTRYMVEFLVLKQTEKFGEAGIYHRYFLTKKAYYEMVELQNRGILRFQRLALVLEGTLHYLPSRHFFETGSRKNNGLERKECLPGRASGEQGFFHWEFFIEQKRREW